MKRLVFTLRLFGKIAVFWVICFFVNLLLNLLFKDELPIVIRNSIIQAIPFILWVIYYDLRGKVKKH